MDAEERIACPWCAEQILPDAKVCRYCGRSLKEEDVPAQTTSVGSSGNGGVWTVIGVLVGVAVMVGIILLVFRGIAGQTGTSESRSSSGASPVVTDWLGSDGITALRAAGEDLTRATRAQASGDETRMVVSLRSAGETLVEVSPSPDGGELSSLLHLAGRRYVEAANAGAKGDYDVMNQRTVEASEAIDDFNSVTAELVP